MMMPEDWGAWAPPLLGQRYMDSCSMWDKPHGPQKRRQQLEYDSLPSDSEDEIEKASDSEPRSLPPRNDLGEVNRSSVLSETNTPYAELLIRMAKALHLEYLATEPQPQDPLMKVLFDPEAGPVALPFLPGIQEGTSCPEVLRLPD
ncbi:UNVERIFIED_CONTAM: hypothetical protein K2H54_061456 [Gekko kuhli]